MIGDYDESMQTILQLCNNNDIFDQYLFAQFMQLELSLDLFENQHKYYDAIRSELQIVDTDLLQKSLKKE